MYALNIEKKDLMLFILMAIVTFVLYYPSLHYDFIHSVDDDWLIKDNPYIKDFSLRGVLNLFFEDRTDFHYHPLTYLSYMIDYQLFGLNPFGFKIHNLILHILCGGALFIFLNLLTKNRFISIFCTLIFLIHPVNMESVVWASCRRQSLSFFLFLISLIFYYKNLITNKYPNLFLGLAIGFSLLSILSKATFIIFPIVFLLLHYVIHQKLDKVALKRFFIVLPIAFFFFWVNHTININTFVRRDFDYSLFQHIIFYGYSYVFYWVKTIVLYPQGIFYPAPSEALDILPLKYYSYFALSILILYLHIYHLKRKQFVHFFALAYFSVTIAGMLNLMFFPKGDLHMLGSNRYYYHSCLGILLYIGLLWNEFFSDKRRLSILLIVVISTITILFFRKQLPVWENSISLLENTVKHYPSEEMMYRLAMDYYAIEDKKNAFEMMGKADNLGTSIWLNNGWYYYCKRAYLYIEKGDYSKALVDFITAKNKNPDKDVFNSIIEQIAKSNVDTSNVDYKKIIHLYVN